MIIKRIREWWQKPTFFINQNPIPPPSSEPPLMKASRRKSTPSPKAEGHITAQSKYDIAQELVELLFGSDEFVAAGKWFTKPDGRLLRFEATMGSYSREVVRGHIVSALERRFE